MLFKEVKRIRVWNTDEARNLIKANHRSSYAKCKVFKVWTNSVEFFTWWENRLTCGLSKVAKCFESWYVGAPILLTVGLKRTRSLCISGRSYSLGGVDHTGRRPTSYLDQKKKSIWVPKRRLRILNLRRRTTQKTTFYIQDTAKASDQNKF